jgi:branched-chain amino acid aminotransferase
MDPAGSIYGSATYLNFNGSILPADTPLVGAGNRGFRYGDGLFETLKVVGSRLILADYHFERLLHGATLLGFDGNRHPSPAEWSASILALCKKNGHERLARVRLMIFRGDAGIGDAGVNDPGFQVPNYIIQSWPILAINHHIPIGNSGINKTGLRIDTFPGGQKSCDAFANLKSNNYLLYTQAARYATQNGLDDCLVLNNHGRIADSSMANVFYGNRGRIYTPPLTEGCIAGIMRRFLIEILPGAGFDVREKETGINDLEAAEEAFLTNSIQEIRCVKHFRNARYGSEMVRAIYDHLFKVLYSA